MRDAYKALRQREETNTAMESSSKDVNWKDGISGVLAAFSDFLNDDWVFRDDLSEDPEYQVKDAWTFIFRNVHSGLHVVNLAGLNEYSFDKRYIDVQRRRLQRKLDSTIRRNEEILQGEAARSNQEC